VHLCTETADPGDHEKVRWIGSRPMAPEVDTAGVAPQQDPAAVDLDAQNTVRPFGDRGEPYLMGVRTRVECG
jgi:hypothetical protein